MQFDIFDLRILEERIKRIDALLAGASISRTRKKDLAAEKESLQFHVAEIKKKGFSLLN